MISSDPISLGDFDILSILMDIAKRIYSTIIICGPIFWDLMDNVNLSFLSLSVLTSGINFWDNPNSQFRFSSLP
jgi:hypothetical protein